MQLFMTVTLLLPAIASAGNSKLGPWRIEHYKQPVSDFGDGNYCAAIQTINGAWIALSTDAEGTIRLSAHYAGAATGATASTDDESGFEAQMNEQSPQIQAFSASGIKANEMKGEAIWITFYLKLARGVRDRDVARLTFPMGPIQNVVKKLYGKGCYVKKLQGDKKGISESQLQEIYNDMTLEEVVKLFGKPMKCIDAEDGGKICMWNRRDRKGDISVSFHADGKSWATGSGVDY